MNANVWKAAIISALCAVLTAALLLCVGIWLMLDGEDPQKSAAFLPLAALYAGSIAGGIGAAILQKQGSGKATLAGALLYIVAILLISLPYGEGFSASKLLLNGLLPFGVMILSAFLWGKRAAVIRYNPQKQAKRIGKNYKRKYKMK